MENQEQNNTDFSNQVPPTEYQKRREVVGVSNTPPLTTLETSETHRAVRLDWLSVSYKLSTVFPDFLYEFEKLKNKVETEIIDEEKYKSDVTVLTNVYFFKLVELIEKEFDFVGHGWKFNLDAKPNNGYSAGVSWEYRDCPIMLQYHPHRPDMGVNMILGGASFELYRVLNGDPKGIKMLRFLEFYKVNYARLDTAIDVFNDITLPQIYRAFRDKKYMSNMKVKSFLNMENRGTIYLGHGSPSCTIAIYDKLLERTEKDNPRPGMFKTNDGTILNAKEWTRFEVRMKHQTARMFVETLLKELDDNPEADEDVILYQVSCTVLTSKLKFTKRKKDSKMNYNFEHLGGAPKWFNPFMESSTTELVKLDEQKFIGVDSMMNYVLANGTLEMMSALIATGKLNLDSDIINRIREYSKYDEKTLNYIKEIKKVDDEAWEKNLNELKFIHEFAKSNSGGDSETLNKLYDMLGGNEL